jgi:hypothetical protein
VVGIGSSDLSVGDDGEQLLQWMIDLSQFHKSGEFEAAREAEISALGTNKPGSAYKSHKQADRPAAICSEQ